MNCENLKEHLASGQPIAGSAQIHLEGCAGCRAMLEVFAQTGEPPDEQQLDRIRGVILSSLHPVRPLPADGKMILIALLIFVVFSLAATVPFGFTGFAHLTAAQRLVYYAVIGICAVLLSLATVQSMIPGSRRRIVPGLPAALTILALIALSVALFPTFDLTRFVRSGIPCLRLGTICAAVSGAIAYFFVRKGFLASPVRAGATVGFFGGLCGVAVLALHCPKQNAAHIIVWHLGAMLLGGAAGAVIGWSRLLRDKPSTAHHSVHGLFH